MEISPPRRVMNTESDRPRTRAMEQHHTNSRGPCRGLHSDMAVTGGWHHRLISGGPFETQSKIVDFDQRLQQLATREFARFDRR